MAYRIRKMNGRYEAFNEKKVRSSLKRSGASDDIIEQVLEEIKERKPRSTYKLHEIIEDLLSAENPPVAARYNLKRALMELGPAGYPFEQFVAELFRAQGYAVDTNPIIPGACVDHEVDVLAQKKNKNYMIEAKFHTRLGIKTDVQVSLYIQARYEDIRDAWKKDGDKKMDQAWIVTNTKFTSEAIKYAQCKNIRLLGWTYPNKKENIATLIDSFGLHPITALTSLSGSQKKQFVHQGIVLCRDAQKNKKLLKELGLSGAKLEKLLKEAQAVCTLD